MSKTPETQRSEEPSGDLHGLHLGCAAAHAIYNAAKNCHASLLNRTMSEEEFLHKLTRDFPLGPLQIGYVSYIVFKLVNPRGHGVNSGRFHNETLSWFRSSFPQDDQLSDGLALFICACRWWIEGQGSRSMHPHMRPFTTADLDNKLKELGFLQRERLAILRIIRWKRPKRKM